jgi:hypothetical protein
MVFYTQYYYQLEISGTNLHKKAEQKNKFTLFFVFSVNLSFFLKNRDKSRVFQPFFVAILKFLQKEERGKAPYSAWGI